MVRELTIEVLSRFIESENSGGNERIAFEFPAGARCEIYPNSINNFEGRFFFIGRTDFGKNLFVVYSENEDELIKGFDWQFIDAEESDGIGRVRRGELCHHNAEKIREIFRFTKPALIGKDNAIGLGDRLGIAGPGHVRAVSGSLMRPVFAQQSIRELQRTGRTPEEVMDAATWAVFQEGYKETWGADADHLKTTDDIDLMVKAGFTMFTIDPGDYVVNEADSVPRVEAERTVRELDWELLEDSFDGFLLRYEGRRFEISSDYTLSPSMDDVMRAMCKYGAVIIHCMRMYRHLRNNHPERNYEVELSVDETESVTSPFEHFLVVKELKRLGVEIVGLAPRFVGSFEKGIDYKGDIETFRREYEKHVMISEFLGPYKISLHSGSDKFMVYKSIGSLKRGKVHIKTAGTSYLEALKTIASVEPELFREIFGVSRSVYEGEKNTYHVSADLDKVPTTEALPDSELTSLFKNDDTRQVMHVAFGKVLCGGKMDGHNLLKDRILSCLTENEDLYNEYLYKHFRRHLEPFG